LLLVQLRIAIATQVWPKKADAPGFLAKESRRSRFLAKESRQSRFFGQRKQTVQVFK